jgi:predicted DNA repair protein MutK
MLGTIAMFLVGGGILVHGWPRLYQWLEQLNSLWSILAEMGVGVITGSVVLGLIMLLRKLRAPS